MKAILKLLLGAFLVILLVYMLMPGPKSIEDFPALPASIKSNLEGDTIQVPNISAYFSDNYRDFVIPFYLQSYFTHTKFPFPPLRLNYPPEFAFTAIKDQTQSTYLEELTYPLRDSLFVNGMEPLEKDGSPRYWGGAHFEVNGKNLDTKLTLRFYPSSILTRIITWLCIDLSVIVLWIMTERILGHE